MLSPSLAGQFAALTDSVPASGGTYTGPVYFADGTEAAPSISFASAHGAGIWFTANLIHLSIAGSRVARFGNGGSLILNGFLSLTNGTVYLVSPSSGILKLSDVDDDGFDRIQLGGDTSAYPALQRNGAGLRARLADDSANAALTAAAITSTETVSASSVASYALVLTADTTTPAKAALRFVPQDTDPSSPLEGDVYYNSVSHKLRFYNGTAWGDVAGAA